jgi:SNF2 family DNA or RNA helicase
MEGREFFALLMAMRTGKTKVVLDDFGRRWVAGEVDDLLVVAPAGVYRTWETAVREHVGEPLAAELRVLTWSAQDTGKAASDLLRRFEAHPGPRLLLVNVEALSSVRRARELVVRFASQRRCYGAVDESTIIKNQGAKRTKFLLREVSPLLAVRVIMSGLPTPKSPLDAFSQFEFLRHGCLGFSNWWSFRARYAITRRQVIGGRAIDLVVGYRDEDELAQRIAPHSFRCRLEDCYDLPAKTYQVREVPMTDEQERIYREVRDYATARLSEEAHVTATQVITQILRLHQVLCGHTRDETGVEHEIPENRTRAVLERRFLTAPRCRRMIATAAAGGRGRTWTVADLVVYHSNTQNLEHRSQSEERAQGVDKTTSVLYVDLVTPGTVDVKFLRSLREKIDMADRINGDNWREWVV